VPVFEGDRPLKKRYSVGLLGAGTVGGGLIRLLQEKLSHYQLPLDIQRVGVRSLSKSRSFNLSTSLLSDDLESIVEDKSIDILVEAMGGLEPARTYIEKALQAGKHVVTANKYVVSECGDYLERVAKSYGKQFLFEASVAGAIPVIEILREGVIPDRIHSVYAILNGTTNFILTRMSEVSEPFHAALSMAQDLGFSEPDPSFDITGKDAGQKLAILVSILKGQCCRPGDIDIRGIDFLTPLDFEFAHRHQWRIKPFAIYEEAGGQGFASVEPMLVPVNSVFAHVRNEYNAVCFDCQNVGRQVFIGKGAGELPTASAVLSDLCKITSSNGFPPAVSLSRALDGNVQFRSTVESLRISQFYVKCLQSRDPIRNRKIGDILKTVSERVHDLQDDQASAQAFCVVTRAIPRSELYRLLNSILVLDSQAQLSWLRVLQDVA
jgi:homoserine dehydrogenase